MNKIYLAVIILILCNLVCAIELNPPNWDTNVVKIFSPGQADAQDILNKIEDPLSGKNGCNAGQFVSERYALFFKPGQHDVTVNVGYYTSAHGLGISPQDTKILYIGAHEGCP